MNGNLEVDIVTPEEKVVSTEAKMVNVPGVEGEFGVLIGHSPVTSMIRPGVVTLTDELNKIKGRYFVAGGFAETDGEHCIILADEAANLDSVKRQDVEQRIKDAKVELEAATDVGQQRAAEKELATAELLLESLV